MSNYNKSQLWARVKLILRGEGEQDHVEHQTPPDTSPHSSFIIYNIMKV
jgi:hypothetical protein